MKDCEKCVNINLTNAEYDAISKIPYVIEKVSEKQYGTLDRVPLCILYGKICSDYKPCELCRNDKYFNFKERL